MIEDTPLMRMVASSTQEECRAMGALLTELAATPRDVHWKAMFRDQMLSAQTPQQANIAQALGWNRAVSQFVEQGLRDEGLHPHQLMDAELQRRGDERTGFQVESAVKNAAYEKVGPRGSFGER